MPFSQYHDKFRCDLLLRPVHNWDFDQDKRHRLAFLSLCYAFRARWGDAAMPYELRCACSCFEVEFDKPRSVWDVRLGYPKIAVDDGGQVVTVAVLPVELPVHTDAGNILGPGSVTSPTVYKKAVKRPRSTVTVPKPPVGHLNVDSVLGHNFVSRPSAKKPKPSLPCVGDPDLGNPREPDEGIKRSLALIDALVKSAK